MFSIKLGQIIFVLFTMCISVITGFIVIIEPKLFLILALPLILFIAMRFSLMQAKEVVGTQQVWVAMLVLSFWVLVINVPTFLAFDSTGFTKDHGLFNAQSLSRIVLFLIGCLALLYFWSKWGRDVSTKKHSIITSGFWLIIVFYAWFIIEAPMVSEGWGYSALSIYRVLEWGLVVIILSMVIVVQNINCKDDFNSRLLIILPILWFLFLSNVVMFFISPSLIYQVSTITGEGRFGALFTHPNVLALVSVVLIAHSLAFLSGWKRLLLLGMLFTVLFFTYSRGGYVELTVVLMLFAIFTFRHMFTKLMMFCIVFVFIGIYFFMFNGLAEVLNFLARGNSSTSLTSLSERDAVWHAAKIMIMESPLLGEGFISGPKNIGEMMIASGLSKNFAAPHAHNEFLQTQLSGGIVATFLLLSIYARIIFLLIKVKRFDNRQKFFLWSILVCVLLLGVLKPVLSLHLSLVGILVIWVYFVLEYQYKKECKLGL